MKFKQRIFPCDTVSITWENSLFEFSITWENSLFEFQFILKSVFFVWISIYFKICIQFEIELHFFPGFNSMITSFCSQQDNPDLRRVTFANLVPGKNYTVGVRAAKQKKLSPALSAEFLTCTSSHLVFLCHALPLEIRD